MGLRVRPLVDDLDQTAAFDQDEVEKASNFGGRASVPKAADFGSRVVDFGVAADLGVRRVDLFEQLGKQALSS